MGASQERTGRYALALDRYAQDVRPGWVMEPDPGKLFLSHLGEPLDVGYLTHLVRWYVEKAALGKRGSCHLFRQSMATLMLENGADVRFVQAMLGHVKLETTAIYTQVAVHKLKEIHAATHPAEQSRKRRTKAESSEAAGLFDTLAAEAAEEVVEANVAESAKES